MAKFKFEKAKDGALFTIKQTKMRQKMHKMEIILKISVILNVILIGILLKNQIFG